MSKSDQNRKRKKGSPAKCRLHGRKQNIVQEDLKTHECRHWGIWEEIRCLLCTTKEKRDAFFGPYYDIGYDSEDDIPECRWNANDQRLLELTDEIIQGHLFTNRPLIDIDTADSFAEEVTLERRLREHWLRLRDNRGDRRMMSWIFRHLPFQLGDTGKSILLLLDKRTRALAVLYSPFWIRSLRQPPPDLHHPVALFKYLFVNDTVIERGTHYDFVFEEDELADPQALVWTIIVGSGASLFRASELFGWGLYRKTQYCLEQLVLAGWGEPDGFNIRILSDELLAMAEAMRLGATPELAKRVVGALGYEFVLRRYRVNTGYKTTWLRMASWAIRHLHRLVDAEQILVVNWFRHQITEAQLGRLPKNWTLRTTRGVLREARRYDDRIRKSRPKINETWKPTMHPWNWSQGETNWSIEELTTTSQLLEEGRALHHCVATYDLRCLAGECAILSLRKDGKPCLTIEFDLSDRQIVQAKGACNRQATRQEEAVMERWFLEIANFSDEIDTSNE